IEADLQVVHRQFPELDFGSTGARMLILRGATLLHVAAEYGNVEAAKLLLERGADANARAGVNEAGIGGQTPIFHAVTQFFDWGLRVAQLLVEHGADLSVRAKVPGHYERPGEVIECTPLGYAMLFPGGENKAVTLLREHGGTE
ncbi:MAG TPA: ankyrin repeat domain-containing protein, partial [Candidatus Acidoferrum sp.]|nr:ankyrin repeat domain-containing protein [Candidatus Acidoferrum sp.]